MTCCKRQRYRLLLSSIIRAERVTAVSTEMCRQISDIQNDSELIGWRRTNQLSKEVSYA